MLHWLLTSKLGRWISIAAVFVAAVFGYGRVQRAQGRRAAEAEREAEDAQNYIEERRRQDDLDVGHGNTDGERIKWLRKIAERQRSSKD